MPRLSILIPCPGDSRRFETTLASVLQNRPADTEVLVLQPRVYDDPYHLSGEVRFLDRSEGSALLPLINAGIEAAESEIVHVLLCGMEVQEGWADTAVRHFTDPETASVSPLWVDQLPEPQRIRAAGVAYRAGGSRRIVAAGVRPTPRRLRRVSAAGPALAAGFYRRRALLDAGGFAERLSTDVADIDVAMTLQSIGWQHVCETQSLVTGCPQSSEAGGFQIGYSHEQLFWRHAAQVGWLRAGLQHPWVAAASLLRGPRGWSRCGALLGRLVATFAGSDRRAYRDQVRVAQRRKWGIVPIVDDDCLSAGNGAERDADYRRAA